MDKGLRIVSSRDNRSHLKVYSQWTCEGSVTFTNSRKSKEISLADTMALSTDSRIQKCAAAQCTGNTGKYKEIQRNTRDTGITPKIKQNL